ncbi:MAG: c-type cytochrome [Cytophagaceae bacterium]|nr:c-type cytochrome [Cytophagaceae bacterium]
MNALILSNSWLLAADPAKSIWTISSGQDLVMLLLSLVVLAGMVMVAVAALYLLFILRKLLNPVTVAQPVETRSLWQRVSGLRPLSQEKDLEMEHAYDGIVELNNPTPPWFMGLFFGSIGFAVIYLLIYHVIGTGDIMASEYKQEMAIADLQREEYIKKVAGSINENTVTLMNDVKGIDAGKALFAQNCTACHGVNAEGKVGPNLTDPFWLHGGTIKAVYHIISEGATEKGMIAWKKQLNPLQMQQVASYILSLQGSNPAGAKEPQGNKNAVTVALR